MDEYTYFMIRVRRGPAEVSPAEVSGVVERIGTGEKRKFATGDELLRFMGGASTPDESIRIHAITRNTPGGEAAPDAK